MSSEISTGTKLHKDKSVERHLFYCTIIVLSPLLLKTCKNERLGKLLFIKKSFRAIRAPIVLILEWDFQCLTIYKIKKKSNTY